MIAGREGKELANSPFRPISARRRNPSPWPFRSPASFCQEFFSWLNTEHHRSDLGLPTPEVVHCQRAGEVRRLRQQTLDAAYAAHPERFVRKPPRPPALPAEVRINPPTKPESGPPDSDQKTQ
jgi:hypothetical protein